MENPPIDVTGLGLNAMDTICMVPRFPEPNGKTRISQMRVEPGGQVATALITCARLGLKARYLVCRLLLEKKKRTEPSRFLGCKDVRDLHWPVSGRPRTVH